MEKNVENVKAAQEKFGELIQSEFERIERMKADNEVTDFDKLKKIVIGVLPGDGIGPIIMKQALRVLNDLLAPEIASGRIEIREIEGCRAFRMMYSKRSKNATSSSKDLWLPRVPASRGRTWYPQTACCAVASSCSQQSVRLRFRTRTLTGPSSVRTLRVSTSGATRAFRSMMTWRLTLRYRPNREASALQELPSNLQERTARRM